MAYRLTKFDGLDLTNYNVTQDVGPADALLHEVALAGGGAFDGDGASRGRATYPRDVNYTAELIGTDFADLRAQFDALAGLTRRVGLLERTASDTGEVQTCTARLAKMPVQRQVRQGLRLPVGLTWRVWGPWRGFNVDAGWLLNDGHFLNDGLYLNGVYSFRLNGTPATFKLHNRGNAPVEDAVIDIRAFYNMNTGGPPNEDTVTFTLTGGGVIDWTWSGTLAVGDTTTEEADTLRIDCGGYGLKTISWINQAETDVYGVTINSGHAQRGLLTLNPGVTEMTMAFDAAAAGIVLDVQVFYETASE